MTHTLAATTIETRSVFGKQIEPTTELNWGGVNNVEIVIGHVAKVVPASSTLNAYLVSLTGSTLIESLHAEKGGKIKCNRW
jgi:hypothetical protein